MKHRITALCLALLTLLAFAAPAAASPTRQVDEPIVNAHLVSGDLEKWVDFTDPYGQGFDNFAYICTYLYNDDGDNRVIDAANEWNGIGGEFAMWWLGWSDSTCLSQYNGTGPVIMVTGSAHSGDNLGTAEAYCPADNPCDVFSWSRIDDCKVDLDMDNTLSTYGAYSWYMGTGSPSSSQVDIESVLVHELGHCLGITGHSGEEGNYVMHCILNNYPDDCNAKNPKGIEKDEL
jgi:hypothetical protein